MYGSQLLVLPRCMYFVFKSEVFCSRGRGYFGFGVDSVVRNKRLRTVLLYAEAGITPRHRQSTTLTTADLSFICKLVHL